MKRNRIGPNSLITVIENDEGTRQARVENFDPEGRLTLFQRKAGQVIWEKVCRPNSSFAFFLYTPTIEEAENLGAIWAEEALLPPS